MIIVMIGCALSARAAALINDTEIERYLTQLVSPIADAAGIPKNRLKINIVHDDDFNAFVRGGDDVFIYTGLLTRIKSPDALLAVVAHEMGHTIGGHMAQMSARMDAEMRRAMVIQALGVGLMVAGGNPSLGAGVLAGSSGVATQSMMAFSRDEERMADNLGLDLMIRAGQDPNGFITVFEQMNEITGAAEMRINPNRVNHPMTTERLKNVREYIEKNPPKTTPDREIVKRRAAEYELVRAKLIGYLESGDRVNAHYPMSDKSDAAIYARAIANMRGGNLKTARVGVGTLMGREPQNPYYYELLGDIEYQLGHYDDSIAAYELALQYAGDAPQIQTALALVLGERGKPGDRDRAIELCRAVILHAPTPLAYWVLARAFGTDDGRSDWAMAEFYTMNGDIKSAEKFARRAQKKLRRGTPEYIKAGELINKKSRP